MKRLIIFWIAFMCVFNLNAQQNDLAVAYMYYRQGEYDKAAELYQKLSNDKNYVQLIHNDYVATLFKLGDYKTAEKFINAQIKNYGNNIIYSADLANLYDATGRVELAKKEFDKVIELAVKSDGTINQMLGYFNQNRKIDYIVKMILRAREVTKDPNKLDTWLASAYNYLGMKDKMLDEVLAIGLRTGNGNYVKSMVQDNFVSEEEINFFENKLLEKIQNSPNDVFYPDILIWWYAQKGEFGRAFLQARALDKRLELNGSKIFEIAGQAYNNKDFKNAARMYQYILNENPDSELYPYARTLMIKSKEEVVKNTYPIIEADIHELINEYKEIINDLGINNKTMEPLRNMGLLQAFYLHDYDSAIATLEQVISIVKSNNTFADKCKLDLGDIYLLKNEPWESNLLYLQVEKSQRDNELGEEAKLKNAKLKYYTGQFELSKEILDVLKKATSKEVANDAMELSLLIEDNTGLDSNEIAMEKYARADLLIFQNKYAEGIRLLDSLYKNDQGHPLADEILWLKANTLLKMNEIVGAVNSLEKIVELYYTDILADDALFLLGKVYEENLGDKAKAMEYYRKILNDFPGSIYNAQARVRFRELRGDYIN